MAYNYSLSLEGRRFFKASICPLVSTLSQVAKLNVSTKNLRLHSDLSSTMFIFISVLEYLPYWIKYTGTIPEYTTVYNDTLTSSATGLSPFQACLGYQLPLFPVQETEVAIPSEQHHICCCHQV